ncbi:phosphoribosylanthranilate transferase-like protein [Galdieria sulphuraria]|uniref:Phosphoribosylanthranilate transferase-like protein n=1 Tax=Galdieria sulphuraria TaxID=130081 RepID=M2XDC4_GALSU|nr:phosphoribosylanthranilate transferase-like protein [Galdieria sulphuraria]EME27962.1 phosphoribosylanthranilate transferase-like protein [Galdieria sulphuraria]|eukprot:XP_005704482.1 phosphoribosylanthranilate transferase-like protein [Galdieria sulphuraria]
MAPKKRLDCFLSGTSFGNVAKKGFCQRCVTVASLSGHFWNPSRYSLSLLYFTKRRYYDRQVETLSPYMQTTNGKDSNNYSLLETAAVPTDSALVEGIRQVAIGKYGAKSLNKSLANRILEELEQIEKQMRNWNNSPEENSLYQQQVLQRAAFLGSLYLKPNWNLDEQEILRKYELGIASTKKPCSEASLLLAVHPNSFQRLEECHLTEHVLKLLQGDHLSTLEAEQLGEFILECKTLTDATLSAMILHIMRVRHETSEELIGFATACQKTLNTLWKSNVSVQIRRPIPVLQITEPFDGVVKSPMVTPLIAKYITEQYGIWTVLIGSDTSGPKSFVRSIQYGVNLKMLVEKLGEARIPRISSRKHLEEMFQMQTSPRVLYMDLEDICPALSRLTYLRRTIIKRPCLATVEKAINYIDADALLTSAFHSNYIDKMIRIGTAQQFFQVFVLSGGIEGGLAFPVGGRSGVTISSFSQDGSNNHLVDVQKVTPSDVLSEKIRSNVQYENSPSWLSCNAELIGRVWDRTGSSDETFDAVVKATIQTLEFLQNKMIQIANRRMASRDG